MNERLSEPRVVVRRRVLLMNERLCVLSTYYQLTSVQRVRSVRASEGCEGAETPREGTNMGTTRGTAS